MRCQSSHTHTLRCRRTARSLAMAIFGLGALSAQAEVPLAPTELDSVTAGSMFDIVFNWTFEISSLGADDARPTRIVFPPELALESHTPAALRVADDYVPHTDPGTDIIGEIAKFEAVVLTASASARGSQTASANAYASIGVDDEIILASATASACCDTRALVDAVTAAQLPGGLVVPGIVTPVGALPSGGLTITSELPRALPNGLIRITSGFTPYSLSSSGWFSVATIASE
jgi:hypothetical protein